MKDFKLNYIFILLIRLTIAIVFIQSGWGKIHNLEKVIGYFTDLKIPLPVFSAYITAWTELIAGFLILSGFLTRAAAFLLFIIMVVAISTTQIANLESWADLLGTIEFLYALMCLGLILVGAEKISVDEWIKRKKGIF
jgi:putative oxidoreductase